MKSKLILDAKIQIYQLEKAIKAGTGSKEDRAMMKNLKEALLRMVDRTKKGK